MRGVKGRVAVYVLSTWLSVCLLLFALPVVSGQSGRVPPAPPQPARETAPELPRREQPPARRNAAADSRGGMYRLVFTTEFAGKESYSLHESKDRKESKRSDESKLANFTEQLNKAAAEGYRIKSLLSHFVPVAVMKFDEGRYEYDWLLNTAHDLFFALAGSEGKYQEFLNRGFQLFQHDLFMIHCAELHPEYPDFCDACESEHLFLFEKEKGEQRLAEHRLLTSRSRLSESKTTSDLLRQVNEGLAEGLYPIQLLTQYEILLGRGDAGGEMPAGKPDLLVVRDTSFWGNNFTKSVNKAAAQGYRLALVGENIAVMYRPAEQSPPVSYVWLNAKKKDLERKLAELQQQGATYRMPYPRYEGVKAELIFELPSVAGGQRREYRVLKFDFDETGDAWAKNDPNGKRRVSLTPPSRGTEEALNSLAKQGFVVRDLFVSDQLGILLER